MDYPVSLNQSSAEIEATASIQAAIDSAHAAGGGRVVIPAGKWSTASLTLRSHVELHLAHGARLKAIDDSGRYPTSDNLRKPALLVAVEACDIALTGTGRIDGLGNSRRWGEEADPEEFRFSLVRFVACRDVKIHDLGLYWSRSWAVHLLRCEDVQIRGCDIISRRDRINADGIDPDDCRRVRISDCRIRTGDDAIVIKSTTSGTCEDILVHGCILDSSCAAIKIGTETTGTIRAVTFTDCLIRESNVGLSVYLKDGGTIRDIRMTHCHVEATNDFPVLIDHTPRFHGETPPGVLEGIVIADCTVRSSGRLFIGGTDEASVRGVDLRNIDWYCTGPCPFGPEVDRPLGAARVRPDPDREPAGTTPHHLVLHNAMDCRIANLRLLDASGETDFRDSHLARNCRRCEIDIIRPLPGE